MLQDTIWAIKNGAGHRVNKLHSIYNSIIKCRPDQDRNNDNVKFAFVSWSGPQRRQRRNRIRLLIRTAATTTSKSHSSPDQDRSHDNVKIAFVSWSGPQPRHSQNHIRSTNWQESYLPEARIMETTVSVLLSAINTASNSIRWYARTWTKPVVGAAGAIIQTYTTCNHLHCTSPVAGIR